MFKKIVVFFTLTFSLTVGLPLSVDNIKYENDNSLDSNDYIDLTHFGREIYSFPDKETGDTLSKWTPDQLVNPEELGSYLEGDILMPPSNRTRNGLITRSTRWRDGVVPYVIEGDFSAKELDVIKSGMEEYHAKTCIRFKPRQYEKDYIAFVNDDSGCWSNVGRIGGRQEVNLQSPGCVTRVGTFIHEVMHALGFLHEQNRHERDDYVEIMWDNIKSGTRINFGKASSLTTSGYGVPYDYGSVMHYSAYAFTKNGQPTIVPKYDLGSIQMGQRISMSFSDVIKIRLMYNCEYADYDSGEDFEEDDSHEDYLYST